MSNPHAPRWTRPLSVHVAAGGWNSAPRGADREEAASFALAVLLALPPGLGLSPSEASRLAGAYHGGLYRALRAGPLPPEHPLASATAFAPTRRHGMRFQSPTRVLAGALSAWVEGRYPRRCRDARMDWAAYVALPSPERLTPPLARTRLVARALEASERPFG